MTGVPSGQKGVHGDCRAWIEAVAALGELREVPGAAWDLEIGALSRLVLERPAAPALLFSQVPGCAPRHRVLVNPLMGLRRVALTLGLPVDLKALDLVRRWKDRMKAIPPVPPRVVTSGPVLTQVLTGDAVRLTAYPAPRWNEGDGGRYIGTGCVVITRDPDDGWVNLGCYRVMLHDDAHVGIYISPGKHGRLHMEKYWARGAACPVAISIGHHPLIYLAACMELPAGTSEYDWVGGIRGAPVEVVAGPVTGLPVPADAELVLEGEVAPDDRRPEGPFGEFTGYYGKDMRPEPVMRVQAVLERPDPIILGCPPSRPVSGNGFQTLLMKPAQIWAELEQAGVPDVQGVWYMDSTIENLLTVVAIRQRYPGHARQAGLIASTCHGGAYFGRYTIIVDDDIDITRPDEVLWALTTRSDPATSIEILHRCWSTPLDPIVLPGGPTVNSRAVIDACRPFERRETFPRPVVVSPALRERTLAKWKHIVPLDV